VKPSKKEALEIGPDWLPTPEAINALPMPLPKYIRDLAASGLLDRVL